MTELATPELLRQLLWYNPISGEIKWKVARGSTAKGSTAGTINGRGYRIITLNGRRYSANCVAWALFKGKWPASQLDHADGDRANNAIANLRPCDNSGNQQNKGVSVNSRSGITGVSWNSAAGGWSANIQADGKTKRLGVYSTKAAAEKRYAEEKRRLHTFHPDVVLRPSHNRAAVGLQ